MAKFFNIKFYFKLMSFLLFFLSFVSCTNTQKIASNRTRKIVKPRIIGGVIATHAQEPHIVSIHEKWSFFCGGSLIAEFYVVTAAHCMQGKIVSTITVHTGTYLNDVTFWRRVVKMMINPKFTFKRLINDVAVLKLDAKMPAEYATPIPLSTARLKVGQSVRVAGWGYTNENVYRPSNQLRIVNIKMISLKKCKANYRRNVNIKSPMMCGFIPGRKDSCTGDSGGPLTIVQNGVRVLQGIVSFGVGCGRAKYPGVYTNVAQAEIRNYILNCMKQ